VVKKSIFILFILLVLSYAIQSQDFVYVAFNGPVEEAKDVYLPGEADDYLANCDYFQRSWEPVGPTEGWLANLLRAPDIATPPVAGPEGGNALFGNSNDATSTREGYWIQLNPAITDQSFTVEVFFRLNTLSAQFAEYKMQNIVSTFWMSDGKGMEIRFMGDFGNFIQLMTNDGAAEHNVGTGAISIDTWYYAVAVYDHSIPQISLYFASASDTMPPALISSTNPNWSSFTMQWLCLATWPNPAGSCRDISGYIDAFSVAYTALDPSEFYLIYGTPYVANVGADWQIYE
jgi:hypothetical protein